MDATRGLFFAAALVGIDFRPPVYDQFPPVAFCEAACTAASLDHREYAEASQVAWFFCGHRAEDVRDARDASYVIWDAWWFAKLLRGEDSSHERSNEYACKLIQIIGIDNFRKGKMPMPLSWR